MGGEEELPISDSGEEVVGKEHKNGIFNSSSFCLCQPVHWLGMLANQMHWSFVFAVVIVYGISQGLGGALGRLAIEYYMKDVQKVQPSESQVYSGIVNIPWIVKPLWGLLTDVVPIFGYHRKPYFIFAGNLVYIYIYIYYNLNLLFLCFIF